MPRLATPASRRPSFAPGRLTAADSDQIASVAISVPRSHASAHQSSGRSRTAATVCAAAKVSQIGPQRRKRCLASSDGGSCPRTLSVASGAAIAAVPRTRSKAAMLRFVCRSRSSSSIPPIQPQVSLGRQVRPVFEGKAWVKAKLTAVTRTATRSHPKRKSLSDYITERFDEFSRSQKDVARYIVDHLDEAAFLTAEELARRASTSSSTVVRFSQALGFEGYPELQQSAIEEYRTTIAASGANNGGALFSF